VKSILAARGARDSRILNESHYDAVYILPLPMTGHRKSGDQGEADQIGLV
jgi:hypothetical protein